MKAERFVRSPKRLLPVFVAVLLTLGSAQADVRKYTVLYRFQGGGDGAIPTGSLIVDASGNFYGATQQGGTGQCQWNGSLSGCGTVFKLSPPPGNSNVWTKTLLYDFQGPDGSFPIGGLVADSAGNLYGATEFGGNGSCGNWSIPGCGIVFKLSPTSGTWTETILYQFQGGGDGSNPAAGLAADASGNLFGPTNFSYGSHFGVVYMLSPSRGGSWSETTIYAWGSPGPIDPVAPFISDAKGNLYSTSVYGGTSDAGTVFELSPPRKGGGSWTETNLYNFSRKDGSGSSAPVTFDSHGNLYGTLYFGGLYGSVFELSPPKKKGGAWTETVLYDFGATLDGDNPFYGVVLDQQGNLYGSSTYGGQPSGAGYGIVYKLNHRARGFWPEEVLHRFQDRPAEYPVGELTLGSQGEVYGITAEGDSSAPGGVFFVVTFQ